MVGAKNIVAVDPVEFKQKAALDFGAAPHAAGSMEEALPMVTELTRGQMADTVILVPSVMYGDLMAGALTLTGKGGTCVITGVAPQSQTESSVNLFELAMFQKEIKGVVQPRNLLVTRRPHIPRGLSFTRSVPAERK